MTLDALRAAVLEANLATVRHGLVISTFVGRTSKNGASGLTVHNKYQKTS